MLNLRALWKHCEKHEIGFHCGIPWLMTMFTHSIEKMESLAKLMDIFIVELATFKTTKNVNSCFPSIFAASAVFCARSDLIFNEAESCEVHMAFSQQMFKFERDLQFSDWVNRIS